MTGVGCERRSVGQCQGGGGGGNKTKGGELLSGDVSYVSFFVERKISAETQRGNISAGNNANVNMTCHSAPCVMRREGNSPTLGRSATDATISISKAYTSRPYWHPHSPPPHPQTPCLHLPFFPPPPDSSLSLSVLVLLQRCYSDGEMWEYLRPSECRKGWGCSRMGDRLRVKQWTAEEAREGVEKKNN